MLKKTIQLVLVLVLTLTLTSTSILLVVIVRLSVEPIMEYFGCCMLFRDNEMSYFEVVFKICIS